MACPQCGQNQVDEPKLVEHLLSEHQIHMVTPNTTSLTRCPVCRKGVSDLSHHFAMEHEDSSARPVTKIARSTVTRIIPIVLPNQPCKYLLVLSEIMYVVPGSYVPETWVCIYSTYGF